MKKYGISKVVSITAKLYLKTARDIKNDMVAFAAIEKLENRMINYINQTYESDDDSCDIKDVVKEFRSWYANGFSPDNTGPDKYIASVCSALEVS